MLCDAQVHPFRAYIHNLCRMSNEKLSDPRTGQFRRLSLHRRLMLCNVITDTSAAMCQPSHISIRRYAHDLRYILRLEFNPHSATPSRSRAKKLSDISDPHLPCFAERGSTTAVIMV
ncbi:hypothetical protein L0F63_001887, partial [Massospora cicadina]